MTGKIKRIISIENGDSFVADIEDIENRISQNSSNLETAKQELSNKCDTVLSDAKAYTDQEKAKYLPLTGIAANAKLADKATADVNNKAITSYIADITKTNSQLSITKGDGTSSVLSIDNVQNADNASNLGGYPSTNYVRSINNISPDENGNVKVTTSEVDLTGIVKSVNNVQPDSNGNVTIEVGTVKSVNSVQPDEQGNVALNVVKSINKIEPDENGNIQLGFEFSTEDDINRLF